MAASWARGGCGARRTASPSPYGPARRWTARCCPTSRPRPPTWGASSTRTRHWPSRSRGRARGLGILRLVDYLRPLPGGDVLREPIQYRVIADQPRARMAATREVVRLLLEAHEPGLAAQVFERGEQLLTLADRAAQIVVAVQDQERCVDVGHVGDRRVLHQQLQTLPLGA